MCMPTPVLFNTAKGYRVLLKFYYIAQIVSLYSIFDTTSGKTSLILNLFYDREANQGE